MTGVRSSFLPADSIFFKIYLIDSTRPFVELSRRQDDGSWVFGVISDPEGYVPITTIKEKIPMEEICRNVEFAHADTVF